MFHVLVRSVATILVLAFAALPAQSQEGGGSGDTHVGDVLGDLVHIKRAPDTGQPILQKRWISGPQDVLGWGYCPIAVDINGVELPFVDLSCDVDPSQLERLVEVDYFGRLSGGRTKERNQRMHFDETILSIQEAEVVDIDPGGRMKLGTGCTADGACAAWRTIDSPMENLALYQRLMRYGHLQTNPLEIDTSSGGDPAVGTVYHPALRAQDWPKFRGRLTAMLPRAAVSQCFTGDTFAVSCAEPQSLVADDFAGTASFLAGAADKTGKITLDLVQYLNRILKITQTTPLSAATLDTLPALIRDENGVIAPATSDLPAPANERFMSFVAAAYLRTDYFTQTYAGLKTGGVGVWVVDPALSIVDYLLFVNGPPLPATNAEAFIKNANDGLRAVEFIHNYEAPADLYTVYAKAPTTTTVAAQTAVFSIVDQTVTLTARVTNTVPVNGGNVTFVVQTSGGTPVGLSAMSGTVAGGAASASYVLPAGTPPQVLTVLASYSGATGFEPSSGAGTLTVTPAPTPQLLIANASVTEGTGAATALAFELTLSNATSETVTVHYATADYTAAAPADYQVTSGTATFAPGILSQTLYVPVVGDSVDEPDETLALMLSTPVNATLVRSAATGRVVDDDGADLTSAPDFNQDGFADLVWRHSTNGRVAVWYMSGLTLIFGTVTEPATFSDPADPSDLDWEIRAVGDFNGDRKPDLLWQHRTTGALAVWLLDGHVRTGTANLTTLSGVSAETDLAWKVVATADMDRDGHLDLVWQHQTSGDLRIWHMMGTIQIDTIPITMGVGPSGWRIVGVADMNGDGWADLVWRDVSLGGIATWLMKDAEVTSPQWLMPAAVTDLSWHIVGVRDMNGDGHADLIWQHSGDGGLAVWVMDGLNASTYLWLSPPAVSDLNWKIVGVR